MAAQDAHLDKSARPGMIAMGVAVFVVANDFTAVSVALPSIETTFSTSVNTARYSIACAGVIRRSIAHHNSAHRTIRADSDDVEPVVLAIFIDRQTWIALKPLHGIKGRVTVADNQVSSPTLSQLRDKPGHVLPIV